jgi:hypothetical protein
MLVTGGSGDSVSAQRKVFDSKKRQDFRGKEIDQWKKFKTSCSYIKAILGRLKCRIQQKLWARSGVRQDLSESDLFPNLFQSLSFSCVKYFVPTKVGLPSWVRSLKR